jgi:preprotein translocase subunit SecY
MASKMGAFAELRSRLLFVLGAFFVYRVGAHIPVPGIDPKALCV